MYVTADIAVTPNFDVEIKVCSIISEDFRWDDDPYWLPSDRGCKPRNWAMRMIKIEREREPMAVDADDFWGDGQATLVAGCHSYRDVLGVEAVDGCLRGDFLVGWRPSVWMPPLAYCEGPF